MMLVMSVTVAITVAKIVIVTAEDLLVPVLVVQKSMPKAIVNIVNYI
jgi:hypothetical protein